MLDQGFVAVESIWWFERLNYSKTAYEIASASEPTLSLWTISSITPRFISMFAPLLASEWARYLYHRYALIGFTWIAPWAVTYFAQTDDMQLDASFKGAWPVIDSVPQGIQANEARPWGLTVNLSENSQLFQWFHDDLCSLIWRLSLPNRAILSDKEFAIQAFCCANGLARFLCHLYLIEAVNANSANQIHD
jgi:hypothetical protein